jgi:Co/Zn/Cd efflux system component
LLLLDSVPLAVDLEEVKSDLEKIPGVICVEELRAWRLTQTKAMASVHVVYNIQMATLQPRLAHPEEGHSQARLDSVSHASS